MMPLVIPVREGMCLLVEDDLTLCGLVQTMLERAGWKVQAFTHAREALKEGLHLLEQSSLLSSRVVLLSDLNLADGGAGLESGLSLAAALQKKFAEKAVPLGIVLMSGDHQLPHLPEGMGFLPKPFRRAALLEAVAQVVS